MANTIYDNIYAELCKTQYPVCMDGDTLESNPETYITYHIYDDEVATYAANTPNGSIYSLRINLYSKDPAIHQQAKQILMNVLIPAGFTKGHGRDLLKDQDTHYIGYSCDYEYYTEE